MVVRDKARTRLYKVPGKDGRQAKPEGSNGRRNRDFREQLCPVSKRAFIKMSDILLDWRS
jgi:hypothetical protein